MKSLVTGYRLSTLRRRFSRPTCRGRMSFAVRAETRTMQSRPVVEVDWLHSKLTEPTIKVLDASWYLPRAGRNPVAEYRQSHIPGAKLFDINSVSDNTVDLPHMLPTETGFAAAVDALGIEPVDHVVVYDGMGLFSAARAWWMFKIFGHKQVSVLNGGFPAWKESGFNVEEAPEASEKEILIATEACLNAVEGKTKYPALLDKAQVRNLEMMRQLLDSKSEQIIDARSSGRFFGTEPEPRESMRPGRIPGSLNIPHTSVQTPDGRIKGIDELKEVVKAAGVDMDTDAVCTCGSGVTACVVALTLDIIGFNKHVAVYDGAWSEWVGMYNV